MEASRGDLSIDALRGVCTFFPHRRENQVRNSSLGGVVSCVLHGTSGCYLCHAPRSTDTAVALFTSLVYLVPVQLLPKYQLPCNIGHMPGVTYSYEQSNRIRDCYRYMYVRIRSRYSYNSSYILVATTAACLSHGNQIWHLAALGERYRCAVPIVRLCLRCFFYGV